MTPKSFTKSHTAIAHHSHLVHHTVVPYQPTATLHRPGYLVSIKEIRDAWQVIIAYLHILRTIVRTGIVALDKKFR